MTDSRQFPGSDEPPYPTGTAPAGNSPVQVTQQDTVGPLTNSITPSGQQTGVPGDPGQYITAVPKKGPPKTLLMVIAGLVILIVIFAAVMIIRSRGTVKLVGTKGQITWWGLEKESVVSPLISEYERQNPNIKIDYVEQSTKDYRERLTSAIAQGKGPDVFEIHNSWVPMFRNDLSVMPESIISKEEYSKTFYPVAAKNFSSDKGMLAIPLEYDAITLFVNEDIFTSALKNTPKTWDEVNALAKDLTQRGPGGNIIQAGVAVGRTDNVDHWPEIVALMLLQNGVNLDKPNVAAAKDAVAYYVHFYRSDKVWDEKLPDSTMAFARNKLAMYFGPTRNTDRILKENGGFRFRTILLPQLPKVNPTDPDISYATYWAEAVWKKSSNSDISWNFLKYLSSPESLQKLNGARRAQNIQEKAYPRPDMAVLQKDDRILGSLVALAPNAKSWYLQSDTNDGLTGLNSQVDKLYLEVVDAALGKGDLESTIKNLQPKVNAILAKYNSK